MTWRSTMNAQAQLVDTGGENTSGWRTILSNPWVFEAVQHAVGARSWLKHFIRDTIQPRPGERILDIGCGPATALKYLPAGEYYGVDHSESYIRAARRRFGARAHFLHDDVSTLRAH